MVARLTSFLDSNNNFRGHHQLRFIKATYPLWSHFVLMPNLLFFGGGRLSTFLLLCLFHPNLVGGCRGLVPALFFTPRVKSKCAWAGDRGVGPCVASLPALLTAGMFPVPLCTNTEVGGWKGGWKCFLPTTFANFLSTLNHFFHLSSTLIFYFLFSRMAL